MNRKIRAKIKELEKEIRRAERETPFTRVAFRNLSSERSILAKLQVEFEKSIRAKEGRKGLVERLQKVMGENLNRAQTIAQTERTRALNGTRYAEALKQYRDKWAGGVVPKPVYFQWVNPLYARQPRHQHVSISGTVKEAGQEFLPMLKYPGDPNAHASQTINCHCYIRRMR